MSAPPRTTGAVAAGESRQPEPARLGLLPAGWAPFLLAVALMVLAWAYWIGLRATPPVHPEAPAETEGALRPGPVQGR